MGTPTAIPPAASRERAACPAGARRRGSCSATKAMSKPHRRNRKSQEDTMELTRRTMPAIALGLALGSAIPLSAGAQIAPSNTTPDKVESSIGTLQKKEGAPSKETVGKVYDYLDLTHGVQAFVNAYQG